MMMMIPKCYLDDFETMFFSNSKVPSYVWMTFGMITVPFLNHASSNTGQPRIANVGTRRLSQMEVIGCTI
eukprot:5321538-Karenia_brevis.AAC.1